MDRKKIWEEGLRHHLIIYRRVSTKPQAKGEFKSQLKSIKKVFPQLKINKNVQHDLKEIISGFEKPEKRIAGKLGRGLKLLKRDSKALMIVSDADRISRTAVIFELIVKQGLGDRVVEVSSGETVSQIVASGRHHRIERQSKKARAARQKGYQNYLKNGGVAGNPNIHRQSQKGSQTAANKAEDVLADVMAVVKLTSMKAKGWPVQISQIANILDEFEIRTTQGNPFTLARLSQFKKTHKGLWNYYADSFRRPRRRIRRILMGTQVELMRKREGRRKSYHLNRKNRCPSMLLRSVQVDMASLKSYAKYLSHLPFARLDGYPPRGTTCSPYVKLQL